MTIHPAAGSRVRWYSASGTQFGHVIAVDEESGLLDIRIEDTDLEVRLPSDGVALLSNPRG